MVLNIKERVLWLLRVGSLSAGQTLVEYSLLLAFVATMIVALGYVVGGTDGLISHIADRLDSALS
jgi:Flp pilus assembly pilin Flp